jgi:uncharacterized protein YegP (UPF0339 family)
MPNTKGSKKNKHWAKIRFEIVRNPRAKQKYHWRAVACNGRIVCHSETYTAEAGPLKTIASFISAIKKGQFKIVEETVAQ